jgi:polyisoprenyl-teichoic acid--peptidoglycan teichoic acid transferase
VANIEFRALGRSEDGIDTPLRHRAEYLLRRFGGRWRIVSYRVERHLVPETIPGIPTKGSLFVLALGSDARKGQAVTRTRADSIHIIGVDLRERKASILGIPRDSYVPIPGHGSNKINAALFFGGPDMMVRTVEGLTGIRMDGYLLTGFGDFKHAVDRIGGITVRVPYPMNDPASGAHFRRGETHLNGTRALAFSRNRKDTPAGDFSRSLNQGTVMLAALRELKDDVARDPLALFRWIQAAAEHVWTDLSLDEMLGFLYAALSVDPSRVRNRVVSGSGGTVGGASVIHLGSGARAMFRDLRRDGLLGH